MPSTSRAARQPEPGAPGECHVDFEENWVGKLIVTRTEDGRLHMYGKGQVPDSDFVQTFLSKGPDEIRKYLQFADTSFELDAQGFMRRVAGLHKDIPHEGRPIGGTRVAVRAGILHFAGASSFGPLSFDAIETCLQRTEIQLERR